MSPRRLYRSRRDRQLAGVAGGIAEYLDVDPTVIRILWILSIFVGGFGILLYVIMAFIVPLEPTVGPAPGYGPGGPASGAPSGPAAGTAAEAGAEPGTETTPGADPEGGLPTGTAPARSADPAWAAPGAGWQPPDERRPGRGGLVVGVLLVVFGGIALAGALAPGWIAGRRSARSSSWPSVSRSSWARPAARRPRRDRRPVPRPRPAPGPGRPARRPGPGAGPRRGRGVPPLAAPPRHLARHGRDPPGVRGGARRLHRRHLAHLGGHLAPRRRGRAWSSWGSPSRSPGSSPGSSAAAPRWPTRGRSGRMRTARTAPGSQDLLLAVFADPSRWRDVVYVFVAFPLTILEFLAVVTAWTVAIAFLTVPVWYGRMDTSLVEALRLPQRRVADGRRRFRRPRRAGPPAGRGVGLAGADGAPSRGRRRPPLRVGGAGPRAPRRRPSRRAGGQSSTSRRPSCDASSATSTTGPSSASSA